MTRGIEYNNANLQQGDFNRQAASRATNYLVYLGQRNYAYAAGRTEFTKKSYNLFLKEWREKGHAREDYRNPLRPRGNKNC